AYRGAAIAQLGTMCVRNMSAESLAGNHIFYPMWDLESAYLNTRYFVERNAQFILAQPAYDKLQQLLIKCVSEEDCVRVHPIDGQLCQSQFRAATLCVEMLTQLAQAAHDPLKGLTLLPRDWQALQMSRELLQSGHAEPKFIDFVEKLCEERSHGAKSTQAALERDQCLALLAAREQDPQTALSSYNKDAGRSLFATTTRAEGLARLVDSHPSELLSLLDLSIRDAYDISALYFWNKESTSWRGWLLSWVYKRMFDLRPIRTTEAIELCRMVLAAVKTLPDSAEKAEYIVVYQTIHDWLNGGVPTPDVAGNNGPIRQAHVATLNLFRQASELIKSDDNTWLKLALSDSGGWIDSSYEFNDGELSLVSQTYRNYVFPSLRLAFVAIGSHYNLLDPAAETLAQRREVRELIDRFPDIFREAATCDSIDDYKRSRIEKALTLFGEQSVRTPYDEQLLASHAGLLLRLGRFVEADQVLRDCLELPGCTGNTRAGVFYDLACIQSRLGNETECRSFLEQSAALRPLDIKHTSQDGDLVAVRDRDWFKDMLQSPSAGLANRVGGK
ncbi:MAG TPA: hypothetical protein VJS64_00320, partial [Pyrinomonadaceae bacterium]|nr:hypothetical protein [Pyrinomonadaceae bacterium]